MKKMLAVAMASTLALSLCLSASAAEPDGAVQERSQRPAQMEMVQRAERPEMGERPEGMTRPQPTEEQMAEMETKRSEMETMKADKMVELEVAAQEAGLTLEEYMETLRPEHCPQLGEGEGPGVKEGQFKKMGQKGGRR